MIFSAEIIPMAVLAGFLFLAGGAMAGIVEDSGILPRQLTLDGCFSCHQDTRNLVRNSSGFTVVHYGATGQPTGTPGGRMVCVDCHLSLADKAMFKRHAQGPDRKLPGIRCEDCHGSVAMAPGRSSSTKRLLAMKKLVQKGGRLILRSAGGYDLQVTVLKHRAEKNDWSTKMARQVKMVAGHNKNLACMDCHFDMSPICYGCHES